MRKTRILVADDHELVRKGLRRLIVEHAGWCVCGEAPDGERALELARATRPDVVVADLAMPRLDGLGLLRRVRRERPEVVTVLVSGLVAPGLDAGLAREVLAMGIDAVVSKADVAEALVTAIERALVGVRTRPRERAAQPGSAPRPHHALTPREREVIALIVGGASTKDVARALGISLRTVDAHRANIARKLDVRSVAALVRYALRHGIADA